MKWIPFLASGGYLTRPIRITAMTVNTWQLIAIHTALGYYQSAEPDAGRWPTSCDAHCTCILSYAPPGPTNPDMSQFQNPDHISVLLQNYTHGQVRFIEEYGLEATNRHTATQSEIDALVLRDGRLIKRNEYQYIRYFRTADSGASIQLWEYPETCSSRTRGKRQQGFDTSFRLITDGQSPKYAGCLALKRYSLRRDCSQRARVERRG